MADIHHELLIGAPRDRVFDAVSTPGGLDAWWTQRCAGRPATGAELELWFGPEYDWRATVLAHERPSRFEIRMTRAHPDWMGTVVGFGLTDHGGRTRLRFHHAGWPEPNDHWRVSCYCWAMYLRLLRRHVETGEVVPYELRLDA